MIVVELTRTDISFWGAILRKTVFACVLLCELILAPILAFLITHGMGIGFFLNNNSLLALTCFVVIASIFSSILVTVSDIFMELPRRIALSNTHVRVESGGNRTGLNVPLASCQWGLATTIQDSLGDLLVCEKALVIQVPDSSGEQRITVTTGAPEYMDTLKVLDQQGVRVISFSESRWWNYLANRDIQVFANGMSVGLTFGTILNAAIRFAIGRNVLSIAILGSSTAMGICTFVLWSERVKSRESAVDYMRLLPVRLGTVCGMAALISAQHEQLSLIQSVFALGGFVLLAFGYAALLKHLVEPELAK